MQCELLGATAIEYVPQLIELLTGLSGRPGVQSHHRETLIKSQASPFTELHLVQQASDGQPLTGDRSFELSERAVRRRLCKLASAQRLLQNLTCQRPLCSWEVCHEGIPVRGKGFVDLPAVVRSRTSATCQGAHSLSFWTHLGFSVSYELVKKGFTFTIFYDDHELQVRAHASWQTIGQADIICQPVSWSELDNNPDDL